MATINPVAIAFGRILVPTDFSDVSQRALEYAKVIAKRDNSELLLAHVSAPVNLITPPEAAWIDVAGLQSLEEEKLEQRSAALRSKGYRARAISLTGNLYDELLLTLKEFKVDLMVVGTHGRKGLDRLLIGSDAEAMLRKAGCPVLSVGPAVPDLCGKTWRIREIICATTLDPKTAEVAAYAQRLAVSQGADLVLFYVKDPNVEQDVDYPAFEEAFRQYAPECLGEYSWLRTRSATASSGASIVDLATHRGSDLIVMGAHAASSLATHLECGTVAEVLAQAPCPVMTLLQPRDPRGAVSRCIQNQTILL
jgi:nucleotide-binding universal stress UspA family protein